MNATKNECKKNMKTEELILLSPDNLYIWTFNN